MQQPLEQERDRDITLSCPPSDSKGTSKPIDKDAAASIRRTSQDIQYQLRIQQAYKEGGAELLAEEEGEDGAGDALDTDKDEKIFLQDQSPHPRFEIRYKDEESFAWQDLSGDPGDTLVLNHSKTTNPRNEKTWRLSGAFTIASEELRIHKTSKCVVDLIFTLFVSAFQFSLYFLHQIALSAPSAPPVASEAPLPSAHKG